jgi:hypothetical protein
MMSRPFRRAAMLAAALVASPPLAWAQAPSVPALPSVSLSANYTAGPAQYEFGGCATGRVEWVIPGPGSVEGTPFCMRGLLALHVAPFFPDQPALRGSLAVSYQKDARIDHFYERAMLVTGTLTNAACPVGCVAYLNFDFMRPDFVFPTDVFSSQIVTLSPLASPTPVDPNSLFVPQSVRTSVSYNHPGGPVFGGPGTVITTFALTPLVTVPEPSTWALMATGLLTLGGVAVRRKRSA